MNAAGAVLCLALLQSPPPPGREPALTETLKRDPANVAARVALARTLIESGKVPEALRQVRLLLELHPNNPQAEFEAGRILQDLAESKFAQMERLAPESAETHEMLGKHYEAAGKLDKALGEYHIAQQKTPDRPGLHFLIGNVLWKLRDFDAAAPELEAELARNPYHTMANQRLGNIFIARDEALKAIVYLERAVKGDGDFLEARRDLGKAYRMADRPADALRELKIVAARRPDDDSVHAQLAAVYRALGDPRRAAAEMNIQRELLEKRRRAAQEPR